MERSRHWRTQMDSRCLRVSRSLVIVSSNFASLAPNTGLFSKDLTEAGLIDQRIDLTESEVDQLTNLIDQLLPGAITPYSKPVNPRHAHLLRRGAYHPRRHLHRHPDPPRRHRDL
ncbi:hypothetical protein FPV67DRAFT_1497091 [Lyophyllum atratum]|nr:hypothetical protein FPV67DRAFT_1497091 [Lyophyllum atratum]